MLEPGHKVSATHRPRRVCCACQCPSIGRCMLFFLFFHLLSHQPFFILPLLVFIHSPFREWRFPGKRNTSPMASTRSQEIEIDCVRVLRLAAIQKQLARYASFRVLRWVIRTLTPFSSRGCRRWSSERASSTACRRRWKWANSGQYSPNICKPIEPRPSSGSAHQAAASKLIGESQLHGRI